MTLTATAGHDVDLYSLDLGSLDSKNETIESVEVTAGRTTLYSYRGKFFVKGTGTTEINLEHADLCPVDDHHHQREQSFQQTYVALSNIAFDQQPATTTIFGNIINDANANSVFDTGDSDLAGVTVYLDTNDNGKLDPGLNISTITGPSGYFSFGTLRPGTYHVSEIIPAGYRLEDVDGNGFTIKGLPGISNDVNFYNTKKAVINVDLFYDANDDGILEPSEQTPPVGVVSDWSIEIYSSRGRSIIETLKTNSTGHVTFDDLLRWHLLRQRPTRRPDHPDDRDRHPRQRRQRQRPVRRRKYSLNLRSLRS